MELKDERKVEVAREKFQAIEMTYRELGEDASQDAHIQKLTELSLMRLINQMNEEIAGIEARRSPPPAKSSRQRCTVDPSAASSPMR